MSESFHSLRFDRKVWLTNHAIESMAKRAITLAEVKRLIEEGDWRARDDRHGWLSLYFPDRDDNLVCAAGVEGKADASAWPAAQGCAAEIDDGESLISEPGENRIFAAAWAEKARMALFSVSSQTR